MTQAPLTLVLGATGKTGRRIADTLSAQGHEVRRGSRSASPAFDWSQPEGWDAVLADVDQIYISFQPDLAVPEAAPAITELCRRAGAAGVRKLVLLSGRGEEGAQHCEAIVQRSGIPWTVIRASWFAQNFDEGHFLEPLRAGVFAIPVGGVGEPFIDIDDIVEIAVQALTSDRHDGQLYEVTGPRLMSFADAVAEIGDAAGREIRYLQVPAEAYRQGLLDAQVPGELADFVTELMTTVLDGRNARVTDGVERALGRPARDFSAYVQSVAATGVWSAS